MTTLPCTSCGRNILPATAEITGGFCRPCHKKIELERWKKAARESSPMPAKSSGAVVSASTASNSAKRWMVEPWFWSEIDEDAPFGNDTGADTLAYFSEWRRVTPLKSTFQFLESLFRRWAIERAQDLILSEAELSEQLPVRYFHILVGDDAIVATAFAQLAIEGRIEPTLSVSADSALSRQMLNPVVAFRDWVDPSERRHRVARMLEVIRSVRAEG